MIRIDKNRLLLEKTGDMKVEAVIYANENIRIEDDAINQLRNATRLPSVVKVLATPDIHVGYGVPIGCVLAVTDIIVPAAVGYDINCGMRVLTTPLQKEELDVEKMAHSISRDLPLGEGKTNLRLSEKSLRTVVERGLKGLAKISADPRIWDHRNEDDEKQDIARTEDFGSMAGDSAAVSSRALERGRSQLGTLGGGNHFCEIQYVEKIFDSKLGERFGLRPNQILIMLHSGSRGFGHQVADEYMKMAKKMTADSSPAWDLCYLPLESHKGRNYIRAMHCAANFSFCNRQIMTILIRKNFRHYYPDIPMPIIYDVTHNIAKNETYGSDQLWVHRKGATRAFPAQRMKDTEFADVGQPVLIPGSMGTGSYLLIGAESAQESLFSVNHGAGRLMSRTAATGKIRRRTGQIIKEAAISDEEFEKSMQGIKLIAGDRALAKEEAPQAYKDIDVVVDIVAEAGLAKPVARMRPLAVLKG